MPDNTARPASPCVRNCCLDEQDICLGCFRHISEITSWVSLPEQTKRKVLEHCSERKQAHVQKYNHTLNK